MDKRHRRGLSKQAVSDSQMEVETGLLLEASLSQNYGKWCAIEELNL